MGLLGVLKMGRLVKKSEAKLAMYGPGLTASMKRHSWFLKVIAFSCLRNRFGNRYLAKKSERCLMWPKAVGQSPRYPPVTCSVRLGKKRRRLSIVCVSSKDRSLSAGFQIWSALRVSSPLLAPSGMFGSLFFRMLFYDVNG
ncbi:hypothetical protein PGTUg99_018562 [Puccinia graminis f. sp. tritici]|uniref:Uncharacterized protein n=1 Tax=Puccinia graminis f. sp. tritici TaxID=56615 RepID=A0A5B0MPS6_PUCGR|nr:hypothetical protein PGTUg99_018562 [Puccinia graminis f. sp. tritici]